jgi:2-oxoglutarate ferredoxin oxidoreductase subunit beta
MDAGDYDMGDIDIAWCPGCGNFMIHRALKGALAELDLEPEQIVMVSGIGQAAKMPQYLRANFFNGLHGRALPAATAIKAVNPGLTVIAESGDGCMYGEGGNHMVHAMRRNPDITCLVHNNMVYGLTKGQASPTTGLGFQTPIQTRGVVAQPFDPLATAVAANCSYVARAFAGDEDRTRGIIRDAMEHRGFSLVDILQPCVSYNRVNTFKWFKDRVYYLGEDHDPADRRAAFERAIENERLPLGVIYRADRPTFEASLAPYLEGDMTPLYRRQARTGALTDLVESLRGD